MDKKWVIEIATSDFVTTKAAVEGGADRIELCANLAEGGTTASYGHIRKSREAFPQVQLYPIIRPRGGDFLYTKDEFEECLLDVQLCKELGCDGVVIGLLLADASIDRIRTAKLVEVAYPLGVTFHRAFDRCREPQQALETLIDIGCERVLTSGQQLTVPEGIELIRELQVQADNRIIIMPGSGVRASNIQEIATKTGCTEFHSSLRGTIKSVMEYIAPAFANDQESVFNNVIKKEDVLAFRAALNV